MIDASLFGAESDGDIPVARHRRQPARDDAKTLSNLGFHDVSVAMRIRPHAADGGFEVIDSSLFGVESDRDIAVTRNGREAAG